MIKFYLVDVKNITSNTSRSEFAEADLDRLANIIIESGGLIKPLVLKTIDLENYIVIDGHFEYYAAVRAREKDARKGEMVNAFVISPKIEDIVLKQVAAVKEVNPSSSQQVKSLPITTNLESRLANLELRFEKQINEFRSEQAQEKQELEKNLKQLENQIPKQITPLEAFNTLSKPDLILRLRSAGVTGKVGENLVETIQTERKKKEFESLRDVVSRVKGLSDNRMVTIIDSWSRLLFT